jgi:uncharacterized protein (DUF58 family)
MIHLTQTGRLFLGVLVLFYFASLTSQSGLLLLPIGILLACYLINTVSALRVVKHLEIHTAPSVHLNEGERMSQPWRITNQGCQAVGLIEVESPAGSLFRLASLGKNETANPVPDLVYQRRGVYSHDTVRVKTVYPFGLIGAARELDLNGEVVVCPAVYRTQSPYASGYDVMLGGKLKGNRRTTSGAHFAGVRPHQPGDSLKHIHWKSSSKGQGLMVKTFDEELSGRISVIMDCGKSDVLKTVDDCVRAAGSLIFAALDAGHHVEWINLHDLEVMLIPPFADGHEILDALARVEPDASSLTAPRLQETLAKISNRSAVSFVVTELTPDVQQAMEQLVAKHRHVSIYLPAPVAARTAPMDGIATFSFSETAIAECP